MAMYLSPAKDAGGSVATGGAGSGEESNIRDLVENCIHNDEITPLLRLVFEAQSLADSAATVDADGKRMVALLGGALRSLASEQSRQLQELCHANASGIATTCGELERTQRVVEGAKATALGANAALQAAGRTLVADMRQLQALGELHGNLGAARAALRAARGVLQHCLAAGELIDAGQLYPALCLLERIRRDHLSALLAMISPVDAGGADAAAPRTAPGAVGTGGLPRSASRAALAAGPGGSGAGVRSARDAAHLAQLHAFFSTLVDDLCAAVEHLAHTDFNAWLVEVRVSARAVGMAAIRAAAAEQQLGEDLARERKAVLAALAAPGARVQDIAADTAKARFRERPAPTKPGSGGAPAPAAAAPAPSRRSGDGFSVLLSAKRSQGLAEARGGGGGGSGGAAGLHTRGNADLGEEEVDIEGLHPGEPLAAITAVLARRRRRPAAAAPAPGAAASDALLSIDMRGLLRCLHVHAALGRLEDFRHNYLQQRRLQMAADLQPPASFLEGYQAYLAQLTGFFVTESYVYRVTSGLGGTAELAALWDAAVRSLRPALERSLAGLATAPLLLLVKDFALLAAAALERSGCAVTPLLEVLLTSRPRYGAMLSAAAAAQVAAALSGDALGDLEVRSDEQQRAWILDMGLPASLREEAEDTSTPGRASSATGKALGGTSGAGAGGRLTMAGAGGASVPGALPYTVPFTSCVPAIVGAVRRFVTDLHAYLRGLMGPWEVLPALLVQRDCMILEVVVDALAAKAESVGGGEMTMRELMRSAANAWALQQALGALDDWTLDQVRPSGGGAGGGSGGRPLPAEGSGARASNRRAMLAAAGAGGGGGVAAALAGVQEGAERLLGQQLERRIEALMAAGSKAQDWLPAGPLPPGATPWVDQLLSYLSQTFEVARTLLPRSSVARLMQQSLRAVGCAALRCVSGGPDAPRAFNLHALERLAADLATIERFAGRWGVPGVAQGLAEASQLCALLLGGRLEEAAEPGPRRQRCGALRAATLLAACERFREASGQAKARPEWPSKKAAEALVKQLRQQMAAGGDE